MRPLLPLCAAFALTGCFTQPASFTASVLEANARGYVIEVKTLPGLRARVESTELEADGAGLARFEVPLQRISYMKSSTSMHVIISGRKGLTKYFGNGEVQLPFSPEDAATIPSGSNWLRVLGGGREVVTGEFATVWSFGDQGGALLQKDGSLSLEVLGPPNATITLEGHSVRSDAMGRGTLAFTTEEILGLIPVRALEAGFSGTPAPVKVQVAGEGSAPVLVPLTAMWSQVSGRSFRDRFAALPSRPLGGEQGSPRLVLYLASDEALHFAGRDGRLRDADVIGLSTGKGPKQMKACGGYRLMDKGTFTGEPFSIDRDGVDEEILALDVHTGKVLGRKMFLADEEQCPSVRWTSERTYQARPKAENVTAWLSSL